MENDIPGKNLIGTNDIISGYISKIYDESKNSEKFPNSLKTADITPIHKEKEKTSKKNYRPVSLTPVISKLFEICMNQSFHILTNSYLLIYLGTQQCILSMTETRKNT